MTERRIDRSGLLWDRLEGSRIIAAGPGQTIRQNFWQSLVHYVDQQKLRLQLDVRPEEATEEDYVLFFADLQEGCGADELYILLDQLLRLAAVRPKAAVVVTEISIYGKCFGAPHARSEQELGYVSHTASKERHLHYMRLAENLACRLAREKQVNIRTARASAGKNGSMAAVLEVLQVLLDGKPGEIYNLTTEDMPGISAGMPEEALTGVPGAKMEKPVSGAAAQQPRSPLSPMPVVTDVRRLQKLASEV